MTLLTMTSPALKVLFERVGRPEVINLPGLLRPGGPGAVIVCNHVGWADSLWLAYAVYPRQLRHISKKELFGSAIARWVMQQSGSISINRADPAPSSIKSAVDALRRGEVILIFPSGTRSQDAITFKRGAAAIALHAQAPIVPAFYQGPARMQVAHLMGRPRIKIAFGPPISTVDLPVGKATTLELTHRLQIAIEALRPATEFQASAA